MKLKNASLQQLIAGGFGQTGGELSKIVANHINQAVLGFTQTTTNFNRDFTSFCQPTRLITCGNYATMEEEDAMEF